MASTQLVTCACGCGRQKNVRTADLKRGWGKYYSKSCKAKAQSKKHGGRPKLTKERRFQHLCDAVNDGTISEEYFYYTMRNEYPEFMTSDDEIAAYNYLDVHPFSSEALGQD